MNDCTTLSIYNPIDFNQLTYNDTHIIILCFTY